MQGFFHPQYVYGRFISIVGFINHCKPTFTSILAPLLVSKLCLLGEMKATLPVNTMGGDMQPAIA